MKRSVFPHSTRAQESTEPGGAERSGITSSIMNVFVFQTKNINMTQCQFSGALDMRQVGEAEEEAYAAAGTNLALSPPGRQVLQLQRAEAKNAQKTEPPPWPRKKVQHKPSSASHEL